MEVELAKVKFDKEAFEEDAETRMVIKLHVCWQYYCFLLDI